MINRNNYEEYFLLYIDNELTTEQRKRVESFINDNPDLKAEFDQYRQTILPQQTDHSLLDKTFLFKQSDDNNAGISAQYHEKILLYIDNELNEEDKNSFEKEIEHNVSLQREIELWKQATLPPETLEFKDKDLLYRKNETGKVRIAYFFRIAVAASIIGLIASGTWKFFGTNNNDNIALTIPLSNISPKNIISIKEPLNDSNIVASSNKNNIQKGDNLIGSTDTKNSTRTPDRINNGNPENIASLKRLESTASIVAMKQPAITKSHEMKIINALATPIAINEESVKSIKKDPIATPEYQVLDINEDNNGVYVSVFELNKNKVNGLLKKTSRIFNVKARKESDDYSDN